MPDVRKEQLVAGGVDRGERRLQAERPMPSGLPECRIDAPVESTGPVHHFVGARVIQPHVPSAELDRQVRQRADREPAGDFSRVASPVSQDHPVTGFVETVGDLVGGETGAERFLMPTQANDQIVVVVAEALRGRHRAGTELDVDVDRRPGRIAIANRRGRGRSGFANWLGRGCPARS